MITLRLCECRSVTWDPVGQGGKALVLGVRHTVWACQDISRVYCIQVMTERLVKCECFFKSMDSWHGSLEAVVQQEEPKSPLLGLNDSSLDDVSATSEDRLSALP